MSTPGMDEGLKALIGRLERAPVGGWRLDRDIAKLFGRYYAGGRDQQFTRSLDAALSLVPEGWKMASLNWNDFGVGAYLVPRIQRRSTFADPMYCYGSAKTPALALVIAALKARAAASTSSDKPKD